MRNTLLPVWLGQLLEARASRRTYSADEVLQLLRWGDPADPRAAAVHSAASQTAAWSASLPDTAARDLGPAATRLPTVIFWYQRGVDFADIRRRLSRSPPT